MVESLLSSVMVAILFVVFSSTALLYLYSFVPLLHFIQPLLAITPLYQHQNTGLNNAAFYCSIMSAPEFQTDNKNLMKHQRNVHKC